MSCDFWPAFFWLDAALIFAWAFFRYREWGIEGEHIRVKTFGVSLLFAILGGASYLLAHTRLEWVP